MRLDGKADEPDWRHALEIPNFLLPWETPPRKAATRTMAKLMWDTDYLYYYAEMEDGDLRAEKRERDGELWLDDVFELFFKPSAGKEDYYEFQVNPLGSLLDIHYPKREEQGYSKNRNQGTFGHAAKVIVQGTPGDSSDRDLGWRVEGRIPWTDFAPTGGSPAVGDEWRFTLCRYDYDPRFENKQQAELSVSAPSMIDNFHAHERYAPIRFEGAPDPRGELPDSLRKVRGASTGLIGTPEPPLPYRAERAYPALSIHHLITFKFEPETGEMLFVDQPAGSKGSRLMRLKDRNSSDPTVVLDEPDDTFYSLAFHPRFRENGEFFLSLFGPASAERDRRRVVVRRYVMRRDGSGTVESKEGEPVIEWDTWGHTGGAMAFDDEGMFYVSTGDGTGDSDTRLTGQDLSVLQAKILRIDVDHRSEGRGYSIPSGNPFEGDAGVRPETYAYGLRNPWRMAWDKTLKRLWVGNNGQDRLEQVYLIERGANYGWSVYEGSGVFYAERPRGPHPISKPTLEHDHGESRSLTGGMVYEGKALPDLAGAYVYGDHSTGKIWAARHDGTKVTWSAEIADTTLAITDFGADPGTGDLLVAHYGSGGDGGGLYRLAPNESNAESPSFPKKLSQTGLFRSVPDHEAREEWLPYEVIVPQWADGAESERYIALSETGGPISFTPQRGWSLPDGTSVFQTLSRDGRRLETRVMLKQSGEWAAYSYAWNDEQTDADLVPAAGAEIALGGESKWKIPSRADCLNCHSRAANFLLGIQAPQLNRDRDYGGGFVRNQLAVMDDLGWFLRPEAPKRTSTKREPPDNYERLADPFDEGNPDIATRARSYLHGRCSHCHVEAGGGNSTMDLRFFVKEPEKVGVVGLEPKHGTQGLEDAEIRIVSPGDPVKSVLFHRISKSGPGAMPPLGAETPDPRGVSLLMRWILDMRSR
ncbi:MAG: PQQ-dependent sugar dehydrogenase [Akkermansiaceae bacterium]|nr:PQQ-dependent sugar dehydrogenase [Akkermansiaceae bacterium]